MFCLVDIHVQDYVIITFQLFDVAQWLKNDDIIFVMVFVQQMRWSTMAH